jgi:glutathione synthase
LIHSHLFVIDPLESLNVTLDSSLRIMFELAALGNHICVCEPRQLLWTTDAGALAVTRELGFGRDATEFKVGSEKVIPLEDFSAIHMRKDPPYDLDYVATTWLLDPAAHVTKIYNHPEALRRYNEKLAIFRFPKDIRPAMVSSDPKVLFDFIVTRCHGDAVIKPLTLFGGRGVLRLQLEDASASKGAFMSQQVLLQVLQNETENGQHLRLVQPFDKAIFDGEVRVFTAFGEPIAWCLKKPAKGQFLANTRAGAELVDYKPSSEEEARVRRIATELLRDGVAFVGFDLIGGFVSEINLTSPRLLQAPGKLDNPYRRIAELVVKDISSAAK